MDYYWKALADEENISVEQLILAIRDTYKRYLSLLYNNPRHVVSFKIHFSTVLPTLGVAETTGYDILTVSHSGNDVKHSHIVNLFDLENFEYSYSKYEERYFVVFDFMEKGISVLQFITGSFFAELSRQLDIFGVSKLRLKHMTGTLIASGVSQFLHGYYRIDLSLLQVLSSLTYEGTFINCSLIAPLYTSWTKPRSVGNGLDLAFEEPVSFTVEHLRQIRKLVELSDKYLDLVLNTSQEIIGLSGEGPREEECRIRLWGHLTWTLTYAGGKKISYYNGGYHVHAENVEQQGRFVKDIVSGINDEQAEKLETIIRMAARQRHGTILIIADPETVMREKERLCIARSAIAVQKTNLYEKPHLIHYLTNIDGALMIDTDCCCPCIGAILDGDAVTIGSPARGARYNSTVNYISRRKQLGQTFTGIVVSEDGTVDAVTDQRIIRLNLTN